MQPPSPREPIYGLDFIRFAAAMAVMAYHLGFKVWAGTEGQAFLNVGHAVPGWWPATWWGWIGVQIFFVVSGVVISYSLDEVGARRFLQRRALRLAPAAWIAATLALPLVLTVSGLPAGSVVSQYARVMLFFPLGPWLLPPFWTLPIECAFYGIVALLIAKGKADGIERLAWLLALASLVYHLVRRSHFPRDEDFLSAILLLQHGVYFALGIALTKASAAGWTLRRAMLAILTLGVSWLEVAAKAKVEPLPVGLERQFFWPWLAFLLGAGAIALSLRYRHAIARACRPFDRQVRMLGLLTYPLYLVHMHAGAMTLKLALDLGIAAPFAVILAMSGAIVAAAVILRWLEPMVRATLARRLTPHSA